MMKWTLDDAILFVNTDVYTVEEFKTTKYYLGDDWVQEQVDENDTYMIVITTVEMEEILQFIGKTGVFSYIMPNNYTNKWTRNGR